MNEKTSIDTIETFSEKNLKTFVNIENLIRTESNLERITKLIVETTYDDYYASKKDTLDRFLDFIYFKAKSGISHVVNLAYPSKRIADEKIEKKVKILLNENMMPEIILRILKFFTRNIQNSDTNLYLAELIENKQIIQSIFETFTLFKNDISEKDQTRRYLNVKSIQQFPSKTQDKFSSPLDAACRLKYVLEYMALKENMSQIYTEDELKLS